MKLRIVRWKRKLIEEEMIADEDGRLHRFRRNLRGLCNEVRKEENKNQTENQALQPFAGGTFPRDWLVQRGWVWRGFFPIYFHYLVYQ